MALWTWRSALCAALRFAKEIGVYADLQTLQVHTMVSRSLSYSVSLSEVGTAPWATPTMRTEIVVVSPLTDFGFFWGLRCRQFYLENCIFDIATG